MLDPWVREHTGPACYPKAEVWCLGFGPALPTPAASCPARDKTPCHLPEEQEEKKLQRQIPVHPETEMLTLRGSRDLQDMYFQKPQESWTRGTVTQVVEVPTVTTEHGHQHPGCLPKTHQVEDSTAESHFAKPGTRTREAGSAACIPKLPEKVREDGMLTCDRLYQ